MTSTLTRHTTQPPGATNGSVNGSVSDSASDTTPSDIELTILLPDGRTKTITVEYGKQMMDLIVQVAASNKLSPAGYTLIALNEDTGRPIPYQASQSIGSLGVTEVELISKKAEKERRSQPAVKPIPAFEKTQRLTVSLPRNQKFVTRVNYKDSLARVFQMVCHEKNLDPYKYELRHPTHPDEPLNMATPLEHYGIHEICVVSVSAQDARRAADFPTYDGTDYNVRGQRTTVTSSAATLPADMPRRKPENEAAPSYMPGMTEKKKKRGILGLFSKRKEGKFKLDGATYGDSSASGSSGTPSASNTMTRSVSSSVTPVNQMGVSTTIPRSQSQGAASFGAEAGGAGAAASSSSGASSAAAKMPNKPPRTKRKAPAPPPPPSAPAAAPTAKVSTSESLTVSVTNEQSKDHHSRNSSHSSGFDEANMSPLESPGNSSRESTKTQESAKTKTSIDASSIDSSEMVQKTAASSTSTLRADIPAPIAEATTSLKRKKRKAPAPPPPPGAAASVSVTTPVEEDSDGFTPPPPPEEFASADGESQSDSCEIAPPSGFRENGDEVVHSSGDEESPDPVARTRDEIQAAVIDELKQGDLDGRKTSSSSEGAELSSKGSSLSNHRAEMMGSTDSLGRPRPPAQFIAPPPPDTPPPPETPVTALRSYHWAKDGVDVMDSSIQVHAGDSSPPVAGQHRLDPRTVSVLSDDVFRRSSESSLTSSCDSDVMSSDTTRTPALSAFDDLRVDTADSFESSEVEAGMSTNKQTNFSTSSTSTNKSNSKKSLEMIGVGSRQPTVESGGKKKRKAPHVGEARAAQSVKEIVLCGRPEEKIPKKSGKKRAPPPPQPRAEPEPGRRYTSTSVSSEGSYKLDAAEASDADTLEQETIEINLEGEEAEGFSGNREMEGFGSQDSRDEIIVSYTHSGSETPSDDAHRDDDVTLDKEESLNLHHTPSEISDSDGSGNGSENLRQQTLEDKRAEGASRAKQFLKGSFRNVFSKSTTSEDTDSDSNRKSKVQRSNTDGNLDRGRIKIRKSGKVVHQSQEEAMWAMLELPSEAKKGNEQDIRHIKLESSTSTSEESETEVKKKSKDATAYLKSKKNKEDGRIVLAKEPREIIVHDKNEQIVLQTKDRRKKTPPEFKSGEMVEKAKSFAKSSSSSTSDGSDSEIRNSKAKTQSEDKREQKSEDVSRPKGTEHRKLSTTQEARHRFQKQKGVSLPDKDVLATEAGSHGNKANSSHETKRHEKTEEPQKRSSKKSAKGREPKSMSRSQKRESRSSSKGDDKPKGDPNEGIEDVADLVEDALKYTKDGDSDASSVTSSVIEGVVSGNEPTSPKAHDVTNEIALPAESEPALLSHKLSESEASPGHMTSSIDHVTTISVGGMEPRVERQESIEKARHASKGEDPRLSLRMDEEITLGQEEIMYVDPEQPRSRSSSKGEAPTSPLRRSRVSSESSSVVSEPNFGFEENVFTEDDIRRFENDYRMPKRNKDEIVEFKFGTLDRKAQLPMKKEEPKKQEQAPVTSLRSLRQAYTRQSEDSDDESGPTLEESGMVELNKKPLFVYTGSDVDRKEQAALFEALNSNIQEMDVPKSPKSPTVPKDDVELMRERRNSGSAASSPRHPSSPRRLTSFEEDTVLSPAETVSPEPVFDSEKTTKEETVTTRDHEPEQPMRPRIESSSGGAAKPAGHSTSFVQSAIYQEKSARPGSTGGGQTDPMKRAGKTSIYDIIKADISQRKGGIHHHVTDTYDDVADDTPASPETTTNTSHSPAAGEMDYLEYDERSKRLSGGFTHQPEEVVLPKQQFFFSSTSVADEYTPPVTRSEAKIHKPSQLLMGPRPWGAHRGVSDPSAKDISVAVDDYNTKNGIGTDHNSNYTDSHSVRTTSSFHSENMTVPQSPVKSEHGPRSELGFSPRPESESDSILEEKSISMIALPTVESQSRARYGSSTGRRSSADENAQQTDDNVIQAKQSNLKSTGDLSKDAINERYESSKSSLQNQYDKLQEQYQRWQHQLAENQELLSRKKILSSTTETSQPIVDKTRQESVAPSHAEPSNYRNRFSTRQHVTTHAGGPTTTRMSSTSASVQRGGSYSSDGDQENQSRLSCSSSSHSPTTIGTTHPRPHAFTPGSFTMGSSYTSRGLGSTGYSKYADSGLRHVEPPRGVLSSSSGSSTTSSPRPTIGSATTRSSSGTGYSSGLYGSSSVGSVTRSDEASVAVKSPTGRKSTSELYRQPMRNKGRSFGSQSSNEPTGPPNKPSTNDLLSAKARLRKGSSEYATEISEGVAQPVESPPPPTLPDSSPPKSPPPANTSLIYTDTPKEGSPGSSPTVGRLGSRSSYSSGSTSSYRSITPTTPKPPPPPTAQPIKSALKQPSSSRGGRKDDPRFGPKLDPREELMIAIRSAGGRTALNKVPVNETKWYYNGD